MSKQPNQVNRPRSSSRAMMLGAARVAGLAVLLASWGEAWAVDYHFTPVTETGGIYGISPSGNMMVGNQGANAWFWESGSIRTFTPSDSGSVSLLGVNDGGQMVGISTNASWPYYRTFTTSAATFGTVSHYSVGPWATLGLSINNSGTTAGYGDSPSGSYGYLRRSDGTSEILLYPGARNTAACGVNNQGGVVGIWWDSADSRPMHTWIRDAGGSYTQFDMPSALMTCARGVNDLGQVVGLWQDVTGAYRGFVRDATGQTQVVDVPGATYSEVCGISNTGTIVGYYQTADHKAYGFYATPVPEPATLSLLALGGMAMLRRRGRLGQ